MTTSEWIRLAIVITAACIAIWAAVDSTRSARRARASLEKARYNARQAIGGAWLMQINAIKSRNWDVQRERE